jgi:LPXTG-motif cell wall-anchored protein
VGFRLQDAIIPYLYSSGSNSQPAIFCRIFLQEAKVKTPIYSAIIGMLLVSSFNIYAASGTENILINQELQIPGAVLDPGKYSLSIEDHLYDRVIVKVARENSAEQHLVLAVSNADVKGEKAGNLTLFKQPGDAKPALRGWTGLEFVYPKLEAAKLVSDTGQAVLAVDPASDKLPVKLRLEDMKVVTLWSLSPERLTADNRGLGLKATKFASATDSSATANIPAPHGKAKTTLVAAATSPERSGAPVRRLPKTASNNYLLALWGAVLLTSAAAIHLLRLKRAVQS